MDNYSKKLLLVEDEALIAMAKKQQLAKIGYAVDHVLTGEAAVTAALDTDLPPDLILMDIDLGSGIDGTQAARRILNQRDIPIVFLSSHTEPEVVEKTEKITSYGYVVKNSGVTVLNASIKMAFRLYEAHTELKRQKEDLNSALRKYEQTAEELADKNEELDRYFSSSLDLLCIANTDGEFVRLNPEWERVLGYSLAEMEGRSFFDFVHPDDIEATREAAATLDAGEDVASFENRFRGRDGSYRWIEWRSRSIGSEIYAAARDISERKEAEEALLEREALYRNLMENSIDGVELLDEDGTFLNVNQKECEMLGYRREELLDMSIGDIDPHFPDDGFYHFWKEQPKGSSVLFETLHRHKDGTLIPMEVNGIFFIVNDKKYLFGVARDIRERKRAEHEIAAWEENLRITLNSIGDAVISTDTEGAVLRMNPVAENLCGWSIDDAHGKRLEEVFHIVHADTGEKIENPVGTVLETECTIGLANHTMLISTDGTEYQIADSAAPIRDDTGLTTGVVLVFRDVTAEYRKNRQIKESKELLDAVLLSIQDGISVLNVDLSIQYANPVMERWYAAGVPLFGKKCYSAYHNRTAPCAPCPSVRCMKTGTTETDIVAVETEMNSPVQWVEIFSYPLFDTETGAVKGVVEFIRDISERRRAEKELEESEKRFSLAMEATADGIWEWDVTTGDIYCSLNLVSMLGYDSTEVIAHADDWGDLIHPDDKHAASQANLDCVENLTDSFEVEYRMKTQKGGWKWVLGRGRAVSRDASGRAVRMIGTHQDITERREIECALIDQEEYLETILETTVDGFWVVMMDGTISMVNEAYCRMSGYTRDELVGMYVSDIEVLEDMQESFERIERIVDKGSEIFETQHQRKDGTVFDVEVSLSRLDRSDEMHMVCFCRDITDRKQAEEEIERQLAEKETLLREVHHRIKNNMAQVEGLLSIQADSTDSTEVKSSLKEASSRVHSIRELYEKLLIGEGYREISIRDYLESLIDSLLDVFNERAGVTVERRIADFAVGPRTAIPVGIIVNELLTNVFKYAFHGRAAGRVAIELEKTENRVTLTVKDDGIGLAEGITTNKTPGFGLSIVNMLVEQFEGTFTIETDHGTRSVVIFDL